jgi:hypothetical protein
VSAYNVANTLHMLCRHSEARRSLLRLVDRIEEGKADCPVHESSLRSVLLDCHNLLFVTTIYATGSWKQASPHLRNHLRSRSRGLKSIWSRAQVVREADRLRSQVFPHGKPVALRIRYLEHVDPRLKSEMVIYARWLRWWYPFPTPLEIRLIGRDVLTDTDGVKCHLRWWQNDAGGPVTVEIAVGKFARNLRREGSWVAYATVVAAMARGVKSYYQAIRDAPLRKDHADRWGDRVLDAYVDETKPPPPWRGARVPS